MNESLKEYVQKITDLPTLPVIAREILSMVNDDRTSVSRIEGVIENDPAIAAKILSVANSAFFGVKTPTKTLNSAIMRIGFSNVKKIAMGISLMTVLQDKNRGKGLDYRRVYNHSISVGFVARRICQILKLDFYDEIMMNGMLHDLGYMILNKYFPDIYLKVLQSYSGGEPLLDSEKKVLDFTHAEIGGWLAGKWNLPNSILDTTVYHHSPSRARRNRKHAAVIHIADYITTKTILSPAERDPEYPLDRASFDILKITEDNLMNLEAEIKGESYTGHAF